MNLTDAQRQALVKLDEAFTEAGECELLGMVLQVHCAYPDSINDVVDALDYTRKEHSV